MTFGGSQAITISVDVPPTPPQNPEEEVFTLPLIGNALFKGIFSKKWVLRCFEVRLQNLNLLRLIVGNALPMTKGREVSVRRWAPDLCGMWLQHPEFSCRLGGALKLVVISWYRVAWNGGVPVGEQPGEILPSCGTVVHSWHGWHSLSPTIPVTSIVIWMAVASSLATLATSWVWAWLNPQIHVDFIPKIVSQWHWETRNVICLWCSGCELGGRTLGLWRCALER